MVVNDDVGHQVYRRDLQTIASGLAPTVFMGNRVIKLTNTRKIIPLM
ncbi:hypothetical protein PS659_04516 [Pseudomonas fluorescens]|uniref:Uncharacterized protein n=1 Tax=Pseudomonas fluorescens TaxID=294 RepID=A0A5E6W4W0_PSEFL|nr:hypothetical protein PS659_04516 [Pseudomonas fluorescens]